MAFTHLHLRESAPTHYLEETTMADRVRDAAAANWEDLAKIASTKLDEATDELRALRAALRESERHAKSSAEAHRSFADHLKQGINDLTAELTATREDAANQIGDLTARSERQAARLELCDTKIARQERDIRERAVAYTYRDRYREACTDVHKALGGVGGWEASELAARVTTALANSRIGE